MGDAADDIVSATYRALCEHGYADLTMQDIADESGKSKSLIHYHYDTKHDLLCAFLDDLHDRFVETVDGVLDEHEGDGAAETLRAVYTELTTPTDESKFPGFQTALMELKAQAPYDEAFRERLVGFDEVLETHIETVVAAGIEDGEFRADVDPERIADFFVTLLLGAQSRHVTTGTDPETLRTELDAYIDARLRPVEVSA